MTEGQPITAAGLLTAPAAAFPRRKPEEVGRRMAGEESRDGPGPEAPIWEHVDQDLARHLEVLRGLIAASGRSEAEIEAQLGWPPNRIRQLLERPRDLAYDDLLALLAALGVEVMEFFILVTSSETEH